MIAFSVGFVNKTGAGNIYRFKPVPFSVINRICSTAGVFGEMAETFRNKF